MAGSVNKVILVGNVGREPEIRFSQDGTKIANFSLATNESWKDRVTGERRDKTEWHRVVVFNDNISSIIEQYVQKGAKLYVEGQLQTRKWTDQSGMEKYTTEVVITRFKGELTILDSRSEYGSDMAPPPVGQESSPKNKVEQKAEASNFDNDFSDELDDEIPF